MIFPSSRQTDIFYRLTQFKNSLPQSGDAGGGRGCHFGAWTLKTTIIDPSHFGHFQSPEVSASESSFVSTPGSAPRHWKQSGRSTPRRRLARKPKFRMRTKPFGSRCSRKRRRKSSAGNGNFFSTFPCARSLQVNVTSPFSKETRRWLEMATRWV